MLGPNLPLLDEELLSPRSPLPSNARRGNAQQLQPILTAAKQHAEGGLPSARKLQQVVPTTKLQSPRGRTAALAQTYMPVVSRSELKQIGDMRSPKGGAEAEGGSSLGNEVDRVARPTNAAMSRASVARREAATVAKCYDLFLSEGSDPQVALHAARAHAVGMRPKAEEAARRRVNNNLDKAQPGSAGRVQHARRHAATEQADGTAEGSAMPAPASARARRPISAVVASAPRAKTSRDRRSSGPPKDALNPFGYMTLGPIAAGAFSQVNRGRHLESGREVAVKTFQTRIKGGRQPDMNNTKMEVACLMRLRETEHPHVANLIELHETPYETHAILVYCSGGSLLRHLQSQGHGIGLGEAASAAILTQLGSAVAHLHEQGVTHRDVKPSNVVFDDTKRTSVRLVDFGFAQMHRADPATSANRKLKTICGSPAYMAPELGRGAPYLGPPVDVWALGCLAYELMHNKPAFRAQSLAELNVRILKAKHEQYDPRLGVSGLMRGIIKKALTVTVSERASAETFVELLEKGYAPHVPTQPPRVSDW